MELRALPLSFFSSFSLSHTLPSPLFVRTNAVTRRDTVKELFACCLHSTLWWSQAVSINFDKYFIEIDLYIFCWQGTTVDQSSGRGGKKICVLYTDHIEIYIITKASDKKWGPFCLHTKWTVYFYLKKKREQKRGYAKCPKLYHPHFICIYIFYIDWVVRTGIRIELFMFVGVVLFFAHMLKHLMCNVFVCLVFISKVNRVRKQMSEWASK